MDGCLSGALCVGVAVIAGIWIVDRLIERARMVFFTGVLLVGGALLLGAVVGYRPPAPVFQVVRVNVGVEPAPERRLDPVPLRDARPITDAELTSLVLDLRTRAFPGDQLRLLRAEAERYRFTPEQGARVLMCFQWDDDRLGALEILRGRLLGSDHAALLAQFGGPFGSDRDARLILGAR